MVKAVPLAPNYDELELSIERLNDNKERWASLPLARKIFHLEKVLEGSYQTATQQVELALQAKDNNVNALWQGEEWLTGPVVQCRNIRVMLDKLQEVAAKGQPTLSSAQISESGGQLRVNVFPENLLDRLVYLGINAEVWQQQGVNRDNLSQKMASFYQQSAPKGHLSLVLGAGNVASIAPLDVIYKMFVEGQVVLLKLNPVNEYLRHIHKQIFQSLIDEGFLQLAYGGSPVGVYLCKHESVDSIHVTGSHRTYQAICFGNGQTLRNTKPVTAELGNVSPIIVVPGRWSRSELKFQAENVASQLVTNAGFNCNAARVLILHDQWPQKQAFMDALVEAFQSIPERVAYYPGAEDRYQDFINAYPNALQVGKRQEGTLPWAIIPEVSPDDKDSICFKQEAFCSVMAQTSLDAQDVPAFLQQAVAFCNETLFGSLNACIIVKPKTERRFKKDIEQAVENLRYGTVAVNIWPAIAFALGTTTWGAYPGHTPEDIQSGTGVVHNAYMFDAPEKSVVRAPFKMWPKPPWFATHKDMLRVAKALLEYEHRPSGWALARLLVAAV